MTSPVEEFAAAQAAEYAEFVATQTILVDGARAYNVGDPVPASNVAAHGYLVAGLVRKADDPAPEPVAADPPLAPMGDPVVVGDTTTEEKG